MFQALADRMQSAPGLKVQLFLDIHPGHFSLRPHVDQTAGRNADSRIALGGADRSAREEVLYQPRCRMRLVSSK